jgi:hypothetical protein
MSGLSFTTDQVARLAELGDRIERRLAQATGGLRVIQSIAPQVELLERYQRWRGYSNFPAGFLQHEREILQVHGSGALADYYRLMLVFLLKQLDHRLALHVIPESVASLVRVTLERVMSGIERAHDGYYSLGNELFVKDLGLCRLRLLPCGSEFVDTWAGVPRGVMLRGGLRQLIGGFQFLSSRVRLACLRVQPLYEMHWDRRLARYFNEADYNLSYLRIADLLEANPRFRGMMSSSWWFDPALEVISPELAFLRHVPESNGARILRVGADPRSLKQALALSACRRALYQAGKYAPTRYMLIWARDDMLTWAGKTRGTSSAHR